METEVTSTTNEEPTNNLKINPKLDNTLQSINKEEFANIEANELHNNRNESSSETSLNERKETTTTNNNNNKSSSGASPKLLDVEQTTNSSPKNSESSGKISTLGGDCQYFFEDEVFRFDKKGRVKFGLVVETPTISDDEENGLKEILGKGEMFVVWHPEYLETLESENSIGLADRTLMPGDIVRRLVPGKETQKGYCRDIKMKADVKVPGTKYVIKNVNSERLTLISSWQRDAIVFLDSWVGSVKEVEVKAILRTASGCRIEISSNDYYNFQDLNSHRQRDIFNPKVFYPGNIVIGSLPPMENIKILTPNIPLHTNKKGKPLTRKFVVESIYTDCVWVNWQCKALSDEGNLEDITIQPLPCVTGESLKRLKCLNLFEACTLQIGDRSYLTYSACDTLVTKSDWDKEQNIKFKEIYKQQKEDYQKLFMRTSLTGLTGTTGSYHHHEKIKKKQSLNLDDKSVNKLKKSVSKGDKLSKKGETAQEATSHEKRDTTKSKEEEDAEWVSTDDDEVDENNYDTNSLDIDNLVGNIKQFTEDCKSTTTTLSTCSSPSPHASPRHLTKRQIKKKSRKNVRKPCLKEPCVNFKPKEGDELVTEALLVYSFATVVWQDCSVEENIPSTQLYPIHHLDNHEFFPGDFVASGKEDEDLSHRDYGVIQTVDHQGRTAHVKWFTTYTSADEPRPTYKGESECSVYDLKDHPDFQYRPGTMVIRVANFVGEDANCTAGQIIDNCIDGRLKVWWVDGHISMCWPQDIFEIAQLDHGDLSDTSEDSWETESEHSELGCVVSCSPTVSIAETHILPNIEKARVGIERLEEILYISPNLQTLEVMRKLLNVYKGCRSLDRLLNTHFFHEDNFMGLIERVRKGSTQTMNERALDQKNRLFNDVVSTTTTSPNSNKQQHQYSAVVLRLGDTGNNGSAIASNDNAVCKPNDNLELTLRQKLEGSSDLTVPKEFSPRVLFAISSTPFKCPNSHNHVSIANTQHTAPSSSKRRCSSAPVVAAKVSYTKETEEMPTTKENDNKPLTSLNETHIKEITPISVTNNVSLGLDISPNKQKEYNEEKNELLNSVMMNIEKAFEKTSNLAATLQDDSGNYSRNENCDGNSNSYINSSDLTNIETNNTLCKVNDNQKSSISVRLSEKAVAGLVCVTLCSLLRKQLSKCIDEICENYYKVERLNLSDVLDDETLENVVDFDDKNKAITETGENPLSGIKKEEIEHIKNNDESSLIKKNTKMLTESTDSLEKENGSKAIDGETVKRSLESDVSKANLGSVISILSAANRECFQVLSNAPKNHKFQLTIFHPNNSQQYYKAVQREHRLLMTSLPPGVYVKAYEDRMDLLSVMIEGPKHTPYEDGMFLFDMQLGSDYPISPPLCHYISYCSDRLNPNLYEDGKVCVSLLGTWMGKDTEVWNSKSTILQVIVSIQGLILVSEPYFNEAGYEKQKGTQQGKENSRMYNEMVVIKMVQATTKLMQSIPEVFRKEILKHFKQNGLKMYERIKGWMELSKHFAENKKNEQDSNENTKQLMPNEHQYPLPDFPLIPASRGFCLTLAGLLENFRQKVASLYEMSTTTANSPIVTLEDNATLPMIEWH